MAMGDGDDVHSDCDASDHAPLTTTAEVNEDDDGGSDDEGPDNDDEYDNDEDKSDDDGRRLCWHPANAAGTK